MGNPGTGGPLETTDAQSYVRKLVLWPFFSVILMIIGAFFIYQLPGIDQYVIWLATTVGIVIFSALSLIVADRRLANSVRKTQANYADAFWNIEASVREFVEPTVNFQGSLISLRRSLAPILYDFSKNTGEVDFHIVGADGLAPAFERLDELKENGARTGEDKAEIEAEILYGDAYRQIFQPASQKQVRRYIRLFTQQEIVGRTDDFKESYKKWLETQATFIQTLTNYSLIDTPRSLTWGAPKSTMIFGNTMVEIFFTPAGPTGGMILHSKIIVPETRTKLIKDYLDTKDEQPKPRTEYTKANVPEFKKYIGLIGDAIQHPNKFLPKTGEKSE